MTGSIIEHTKKEPKSIGSAALFVSLYLVVLAFFILLNALSKIDPEKTKQAVESVNNTFATMKTPTLERFDQNALPHGEEISLGDNFAVLREFIEDAIYLKSVKVDTSKNTMMMSFSTNELFVPGSDTIQTIKIPTLQRIADNLSREQDTQPLDIEFTISTPKIEDGDNFRDILRAGAFARKLIELGAPKHLISAGIMHGEKDVVTIMFYKKKNQKALFIKERR